MMCKLWEIDVDHIICLHRSSCWCERDARKSHDGGITWQEDMHLLNSCEIIRRRKLFELKSKNFESDKKEI